MKINKTKVKEFVKTNKKRIIYGSVLVGTTVVAYAIGKRNNPSDIYKIIANPDYNDIGQAVAYRYGAKRHFYCGCMDNDFSIKDWDHIKKLMLEAGLTDETKLVGLIAYIDPYDIEES